MSFERPLVIEMIRSESQKFSDRARRGGKFGQVPDDGRPSQNKSPKPR